jgi:superfamily I DNA and/or RNA helicase
MPRLKLQARRTKRYSINKPVAFVNIIGSQRTFGHNKARSNETKVDAVVEYLYAMIRNGAQTAEITVITGYQGQRKLLLNTLSEERKFADVTVATADSYQGATESTYRVLGCLHGEPGL